MNKAPIFQHRHYKAIAAMLHEAIYAPNAEHKTLYQVRDQLADMFASDNPRFDRERFMAATAGNPSDGRDKVKA